MFAPQRFLRARAHPIGIGRVHPIGIGRAVCSALFLQSGVVIWFKCMWDKPLSVISRKWKPNLPFILTTISYLIDRIVPRLSCNFLSFRYSSDIKLTSWTIIFSWKKIFSAYLSKSHKNTHFENYFSIF